VLADLLLIASDWRFELPDEPIGCTASAFKERRHVGKIHHFDKVKQPEKPSLADESLFTSVGSFSSIMNGARPICRNSMHASLAIVLMPILLRARQAVEWCRRLLHRICIKAALGAFKSLTSLSDIHE